MQYQVNRKLLVHSAGLICFTLFSLLALNSHFSFTSSLYIWLFVVFSVTGISALLWSHYQFNKISIVSYAILFWAIVFRLVGLFSEPLLEDDYYRFLWDGYVFSEQGTPYNITPESYFEKDINSHTWESVLNGISYPEKPTIYGPTLQYLFLFCSKFSPGSELFLRAILTLLEISLLIMFFYLFKHKAVIVLYAWCPLLIKEVSFSGHPDIVGILFLVLGILLINNAKYLSSGVMLALAIAVKPFAILMAPFFIIKNKVLVITGTVLTLTALYLPFIVQGGGTEYTALINVSKTWEFNSSLYAVLNYLFRPEISKFILLSSFTLVFFTYWITYFRNNNAEIPRGDILFLLLFLLSPVFNPWYTLWMLPFLLLYPSLWGWSVPAAVTLSYICGINLNTMELGSYDHPSWVRIIEFSIILIAILSSIWLKTLKRVSRA